MTSYERGYQLGQAFGYLLVGGVILYFAILRPRLRKRKQKKKDEPLDQV